MDDLLDKELSVLKKVNQAISYAPDVEAVASAILDIVLDETLAQNASIMMPSSDRTSLEIRAAKGSCDQNSRYSEQSLGQVFPMGEGIAGMVALSREPTIIKDASCDPLFQSRDIKIEIGSMLSMPLVYGKAELVGVINLSHPEPDAFSQTDLSLLHFLLPPAALALRNARVMKDIEDINLMLKDELSMNDRALKEFGKNILRVFNYMSIGVLTMDPDGLITTINKKASELLNLSTGENLWKVINSDVKYQCGLDMGEVCLDVGVRGKILQLELSPLPLKPLWQILVCIRDVSLERFKEHELVRVKDQYKDMVENAIDAVYIVKGGRFLLTNQKFQEMLGYDVEDILNKHFRHFITRESLHELAGAIRSKKGNSFIPNLEIHALKKDGRRLYLEISIGRLKIDNDLCFVGVVRDITGKKELLGLKSRFLHVASHEIRVPLTVIRGYARMLGRNTKDILSSEQMECIEEIEKQCERLLHFSNSLLNFARINSGKLVLNKQSVNMYDHMRNIVRNMQIKANEVGVNIVFEGDTIIPALYVDPIKIDQALYNLIDNAIKHSPPSGEVRIRFGLSHIEHDDLGKILKQKSVLISVMDQGPGISSEEAKELFSEFYVGKSGRAKQGIGLGLAITKEIIHAHGGYVEACPSKNGGLFSITLPLNGEDN